RAGAGHVEIGLLQVVFLDDARSLGEGALTGAMRGVPILVGDRRTGLDRVRGVEAEFGILSAGRRSGKSENERTESDCKMPCRHGSPLTGGQASPRIANGLRPAAGSCLNIRDRAS